MKNCFLCFTKTESIAAQATLAEEGYGTYLGPSICLLRSEIIESHLYIFFHPFLSLILVGIGHLLDSVDV